MKIATVVILLCTGLLCYAQDEPSTRDYIITLPAQPIIAQNDMPPYTAEMYKTNNTKQPAIIGYTDKGDSIEFVFGQQATIRIGNLEIALEKRRDEIKQVNLAGSFNGWNPANKQFVMKKTDSKLYKLMLAKKALGKKGDLQQFKFVINEKYWVEPPAEASNKLTGKDKNTNLLLQL
jgi:serine-type D-Ala-D-Ala carboxypeptidase/endopeptidase